MIHNYPFNESPPRALLESVDTKARGLWSAKKSIKGGSLQTLPPIKTNYIPQTSPIKAIVNISIRFLWTIPEPAIDRVQGTLRKMARKENCSLLIIELVLETFICSLLLLKIYIFS